MDPNSVSDLRHIRSQGANVGDRRMFGSSLWRWNGERWEVEPNHQQPNHIPTAAEILESQMAPLKEQVTFLKDYLQKNPFAFDENLARQMAKEKYNPYYREILDDYVKPLQEKISRSTEDQAKMIVELSRQREFQTKEYRDQIQEAVSAAREGFAGSGLFESGAAKREENKIGITGNAAIGDYMAKSQFQENQINTQAQRERADTQTLIDQRNRDIFGTGRELDTKVAQDVEQQRGTAQKQYGTRVLESVTSRYGNNLIPNIQDYLKLS